MFQDGIAALQAADPALYAKMAAQQGGGALSADVHEKLRNLIDQATSASSLSEMPPAWQPWL